MNVLQGVTGLTGYEVLYLAEGEAGGQAVAGGVEPTQDVHHLDGGADCDGVTA